MLYKYVILKAEVSPFTRTKRGKLERVKGWFVPDEGRSNITYPATDKGFFDFVKMHIGLDKYGELISDIAKNTPDIRVAINDAYLVVVNAGAKGTEQVPGLNLRSYVLKDKPGLVKFLGKVYEMVKDDILSVRKDLRKSRRIK